MDEKHHRQGGGLKPPRPPTFRGLVITTAECGIVIFCAILAIQNSAPQFLLPASPIILNWLKRWHWLRRLGK